jgi:hypothetical protein
VCAVGLDQVDGFLDLADRLDARLARLEGDRRGELDGAVPDPLGGLPSAAILSS